MLKSIYCIWLWSGHCPLWRCIFKFDPFENSLWLPQGNTSHRWSGRNLEKDGIFSTYLLLIQRILLENHDLPWFAQAIRYLSFSCKNKHGKSVSNMPSFWDTTFTYMNTSLHFNVSSEFTILSLIRCKRLTPVVQRVGNFIQHVRCYPADKLYWLEYILSTW